MNNGGIDDMEVIETLKDLLGKMYEEYGHNEINIAISQYLDDLIVQEQRRRLSKCLKQ